MATKGMSRGTGFGAKQVVIDEIISTTGIAICRDSNTQQVEVPVYRRRAKGGWPMVGETWMISREFGYWEFASFVSEAQAPAVAAPPVEADPWLHQMYDALVASGLIREAAEANDVANVGGSGEDVATPDEMISYDNEDD